MKKNKSTLTQTNDSSNQTLSVGELANQIFVPQGAELEKVLKDKCNILSQAVDHLQKQLNLKEEEILVLRSQLEQQNNTPGLLSVLPPSDEEIIIEAQMRILKQNGALQRELSLDEVKRLDLLIKNKKLVKTPEAPIESENTLKNKSQSELLKLASKGK